MSLPLPKLDDRTFDQLIDAARLRMSRACPEWTDHSVGEPGMVLLDAFAYLTETVVYRLNKLPAKAYVAFLNLIDVRLQPPAAAETELLFSAVQPVKLRVEIPEGTRVATSRPGPGGEPVLFATNETVVMEAGQTEARVKARHCEQVDAELIGTGSGLPGLTVRIKRAPVIARTLNPRDLMVGVETDPDELADRAPARPVEDKTFRIWSEVDNFVVGGTNPFVYVADRMSGLITFAPAVQTLDPKVEVGAALGPIQALAGVPPQGKQIRVWYRRGGGSAGNVAAGMLDTLKDPIAGVSLKVTNPGPATGGREAESLDNALVRGPVELHSLRRAVTARDFEGLALRNAGGVTRAKAFTQRALWEHAVPGTVDVVLVPNVQREQRGAFQEKLNRQMLEAHHAEPERQKVSRLLDERRPLGTSCLVRWARYVPVAVKVEIVAHQVEDPELVRTRIERQLYQALSPLPDEKGEGGWQFGESLVKSRIYDIVNSDPGVKHARRVQLQLERAPRNVTCLEADRVQARTWYAGSESTVFRSTNDGESWEPIREFAGELVHSLAVHWGTPGCLAVETRVGNQGDSNSRIHVSRDCGESWAAKAPELATVAGLGWTSRDRAPLLLIANKKGLFELGMKPDAVPVPVLVYPKQANLGFTAIATGQTPGGAGIVAVSAESATEGVFVSTAGGKAGSFTHIGLVESIRVLELQRVDLQTYLWAGLAASGSDDDGRGCQRWEVREGTPTGDQKWEVFGAGWLGGSVYGLAFAGRKIYAATHRRGILTTDSGKDKPTWEKPEIRIGLPLREVENQVFKPVNALAAGSSRDGDAATLIAATEEGIFRKERDRSQYVNVSHADGEVVRVPDDWLICSGRHEVTIARHES